MRSLLRQLIWNCSFNNKDVSDAVVTASILSLGVIGITGLLVIIAISSWNAWVGVAIIGFLVYKLFRYALHKDVEE